MAVVEDVNVVDAIDDVEEEKEEEEEGELDGERRFMAAESGVLQ